MSRIPNVPRGAVVRALTLALLVGAGFLAFRWGPLAEWADAERIARFLGELRASPWAVPVLLTLFVLCAPSGIPVSPLIFAGGAVFGVWLGWLYNFFGVLAGALVSYALAWFLGRDMIVALLNRRRLQQVERALERHGFWTMVRIRFVPLPFVLINFGAALAGVPFRVFLSSSVIGLIPSVFVYTFFAHALARVAEDERAGVVWLAIAVIGGMLALTLLAEVLGRKGGRPPSGTRT